MVLIMTLLSNRDIVFCMSSTNKPDDKTSKLCNLRIFNGCSVQTENSVTRVTVRYHEARRV